jgi:hypothetical protein
MINRFGFPALAFAIALVGALAAYSSRGLALFEEFTVGPGVAPVGYGIAVAVIGLALGITDLMQSRQTTQSELMPPEVKRKALYFVGLLLAMVLLLEPLGFPVVATLFCFAGLILVCEVRPLRALPTAVGIAAAFYFIFVVMLHLPIPNGALLKGLT